MSDTPHADPTICGAAMLRLLQHDHQDFVVRNMKLEADCLCMEPRLTLMAVVKRGHSGEYRSLWLDELTPEAIRDALAREDEAERVKAVWLLANAGFGVVAPKREPKPVSPAEVGDMVAESLARRA